MRLELSEICKYGACTVSSRNFREGEKLLNSNYITKCGRIRTESNTYKIIAYCRQYSSPDEKPHEVKGDINSTGSICTFTCSCKAGLGEKCKHILAVLLFCSR